jgi:hypothetical protein
VWQESCQGLGGGYVIDDKAFIHEGLYGEIRHKLARQEKARKYFFFEKKKQKTFAT